MKLHPWIKAKPDLVDWINTITVTAQLMDYKVMYHITDFHNLYDDDVKINVARTGSSDHLEILDKDEGSFAILTFSFLSDGSPIRLKLDVQNSEGYNREYFSNNIDRDLPRFQKRLEESIV